MRITQEADYALRIVCLLAMSEKITGASEISESVGVTPRFALKILRKLVIGEVVKSYKGASGGYSLAKSAEEITMRKVIELIDGPFAISKCIEEGKECAFGGLGKSNCILHHVFGAISDDVAEKLDRVPIALIASGDTKIEDVIKLIK